VQDSDVLVSWLAAKKIIEKGQKLRLIQCWGVGIDEIDMQLACQRGINVCNLAGYNSSAVAEYTLCMMLLLARNCRQVQKKFSERLTGHMFGGDNFENQCSPPELAGKVLLIVGYGSIGQQIALRARSFGMKVLAIKRTPPNVQDPNIEFIGTRADMQKIIQTCDFVSINLPFTKETKGYFGAQEFEAMKHTAYFINTSRGGIVDDKALLSALKKGSIAGAAVDVLDEQMSDSFTKLNDVIVTPHISGLSEESTIRGVEVTSENIKRLINGQPLLNLISTERMY
jgi:D-3-phosphoglycerate dehydrogenase